MSIANNGFVFVTPVWGSYVDTFLDLCIPSLLTPGNLPAIDVPAIFQIYTTPEDRIRIEQSPVYQQLTKIIPTEILFITSPILNSFRTITNCHQQAFDYADHKDAGVFIIMPDFVFSSNYCAAIQQHAKNGARVISVPNFSINLDESKAELSHWINNQGVLDITPRELMQVGMRNLHLKTHTHIWEQEDGYLLPSILFWRVANNGGLLGRYFYGCYNYVYPTDKFSQLHATMDVDYIFHACPDQSLHLACTDSDELLVLEMSNQNKFCAGFPKAFPEHLRYYVEHLNPYLIKHSKHVFKLSTGLASPADWNAAGRLCSSVFDNY